MGKIIELIKSFINPVEPEKSLSELAVAAGMSEADMKLLNQTSGGISWAKFAREEEKTKKSSKISNTDAKLTQKEPKTAVKEKAEEFERD